MRVFKNLCGDNSKIHADEVVFKKDGHIITVPEAFSWIKEQRSFKGLLLSMDSDMSIQSEVDTFVRWGNVIYNYGNFNPSITQISIPEGVSKVIVRASLLWGNTSSGYRRMTIMKNGGFFAGSGQMELPPVNGVFITMVSTPVLVVSPGDYFQVRANHNRGSSLNIYHDPRSWFAVEVIE